MKRILLIEDVEQEREVYERLYHMCQFHFHGEVEFLHASTWEIGGHIVATNSPDVVILDLTLPDSTAEETIGKIAQVTPEWPPVIVLTGAVDTKELRSRSILLGASDFIRKMDVRRDPSILCERVYIAYLNRLRENRLHEQRA